MTRFGIEKRKLQHEATKASAAAKSADAAERDSKVREKESVSKRFSNYAGGAGALARGAGGLMSGIAALNDPSWYKKTGATDQTARLASNPGPGSGLPTNFLDQNSGETIPTVLAVQYVHTIGPAYGNANDPINYAAAYLQSQLRRYNSRSGTDYDPSDLIMLQVYGASTRAEIEDIRFCLGAYNTFSATHKSLAKCLIEAKGFDFSVFQSNRAEIITKLNEVIIRMNYIPTIKSLSVCDRWKFLAQVCIRDARTLHGSYYVFKNLYRPEYDPENSRIQFKPRSSNVITELNSLLSAVTDVTDSASMVIMLSDLRGAISDNEFIQTDLAVEDYKVVLSESREMIDQIHNITLAPMIDATTENNGTVNTGNTGESIRNLSPYFWNGEYGPFDIYQSSKGYLAQGTLGRNTTGTYDAGICLAPYLDSSGNPTTALRQLPDETELPEIPLDFDKDEINVDDILVASRFTVFWKPTTVRHSYTGGVNKTGDVWVPTHYGTELAICVTIVSCAYGGNGALLFDHITEYTNTTNWINSGSRLGPARLHEMHWAPRLYIVDEDCHTESNYQTLLWDVGRLVPYSKIAQQDINYMCVLSEFSLEDIIFKRVA